MISAVVSASFSVAGLLGDGRGDTHALYAASRSVALPVVARVHVAAFAKRHGGNGLHDGSGPDVRCNDRRSLA